MRFYYLATQIKTESGAGVVSARVRCLPEALEELRFVLIADALSRIAHGYAGELRALIEADRYRAAPVRVFERVVEQVLEHTAHFVFVAEH